MNQNVSFQLEKISVLIPFSLPCFSSEIVMNHKETNKEINKKTTTLSLQNVIETNASLQNTLDLAKHIKTYFSLYGYFYVKKCC